MNRAELIKYYEKQLEKVKKQYSDELHKSYVKYAEKQLEEVKNGREW